MQESIIQNQELMYRLLPSQTSVMSDPTPQIRGATRAKIRGQHSGLLLKFILSQLLTFDEMRDLSNT